MEFTSIQIPDHAWEPSGDNDNPRARLLASMGLNGQPFHVEAYQVKTADNGEQVVADPTFESEWLGICALQNDGGAFRTVFIEDREYVIVVSPFLA